ncbi:hypothetical protein EBZ80_19815 [bacterium]|nr:hypothetical protein [bacterium]
MGAFLDRHVNHSADADAEMHRWIIRDHPTEATVIDFCFDRTGRQWVTCRKRGNGREYGLQKQKLCYLFSFPDEGELWIVCGPSHDAHALVLRVVDADTVLQWSLPRMGRISLVRKQVGDTVIPSWATPDVQLLGHMLFSRGDDLQEFGTRKGLAEVETHDRLG